jgi:6-phosphogluconolactonase
MPSAQPEIQILSNAEELSGAGAKEFVRRAGESADGKASFAVALSGGSTPKSLYALLASEAFREQLPWGKVHFFWGDERPVPPEHPDSNYRMAHDSLLSKVPVPPENVHRIRAEIADARKAADAYEQTLREFFQLRGLQTPCFDLVLLGMGSDGHTASIFPGSAAVHEQERLAVAPWVEKLQAYRITLTAPVFNNAACVIFLVSGREKAEALRAVLEGDYQPERFPAQLIRPTHGTLLWLVDRAAASLLQLKGER